MWSFVKRKIGTEADDNNESPQQAEDGRQWIWVSYAPEFRLILAMAVGPRTYETALMLIQITATIVSGVPCFFSDGFSCYYNALIEHYHKIKIFPRTGKRGRPKDPVKEPHPDLIYGQIVKENKGGRLVKITYREKGYHDSYIQAGKNVILVGIDFSRKKRNIVVKKKAQHCGICL